MREFVIPIKVHDAELPVPEHKSWGDWVDLRAAETVEMKQGEFRIISLGVSMRLPNGYEANVVPRSSTFKNFGVLMANSFGVIDNNYCGNDDVWGFPAIAMRDTVINKGDRIAQFRIVQRQPKLVFAKVDDLNSKNRGGFGSTGIK
jgi:dUTP pyrophosphatase